MITGLILVITFFILLIVSLNSGSEKDRWIRKLCKTKLEHRLLANSNAFHYFE